MEVARPAAEVHRQVHRHPPAHPAPALQAAEAVRHPPARQAPHHPLRRLPPAHPVLARPVAEVHRHLVEVRRQVHRHQVAEAVRHPLARQAAEVHLPVHPHHLPARHPEVVIQTNLHLAIVQIATRFV